MPGAHLHVRPPAGGARRPASRRRTIAAGVAIVSSLVLGAACAAPPSLASTHGVLHSRSARVAEASHSLITATEFSRVSEITLYDAVRRLRPEFLLARNPSLSRPLGSLPVAYLDGLRLGDATELRRLSASEAWTVELLAPSAARMRFVGPHDGGAIVVTRRR